MKAHRLPVRSRPAGRERAPVHRRRARRHPHHHALQPDRSAHRADGRAARDRSRDVRRRPAGSVARPAGRARSRHGDAGEPVAAAGDADLPQPAVPALHEAAAGEGVRRRRGPGMGSREPVPAADPRAAQPDPRRCGRSHLSRAHHAALRARERDPEGRAQDQGSAGSLEHAHAGSPRRAAGERRRRLPAGRALGRRLVRLLSLVRDRRGDRRAAVRKPAGRAPGAGRGDRRRPVRRSVRLAAPERARRGRDRQHAGAHPQCHRQAAVRRRVAALCRRRNTWRSSG